MSSASSFLDISRLICQTSRNDLYASLVEVSYAIVTSVVITGIGYVELAHEFRKVGFWGFEKQMENDWT
jgi:hypothetical protein